MQRQAARAERDKALAQLMPKRMQEGAKPRSFVARLSRSNPHAVSAPALACAPALGLAARERGAPDVQTPMGTLGERTSDFLATREEYVAYSTPS